MTPDEARRRIWEAVEQRQASFFSLLEHAVYAMPRSPYRRLLEWAGCELGDLESLVRDKGIEGALRQLRGEGVYVTFEEFKGREPIVRSGRTFETHTADFDNPLLGGSVRRSTGGTTGVPSAVPMSLRDLEEKSPIHLMGYEAHGLLGAPTASLREGLSGLGVMLTDAIVGNAHERWFSPPTGQDRLRSFAARATTALVAAACRVGGQRFARPEPLAYERFDRVAEWAASRVREDNRSVVRTNASHALRVASAALENGIDLTGVTFMGGGDPATPGKVSRIVESGAFWVPVYVMSETGRVGIGCAQPVDGSDVHLCHHMIAVITYPRTVPGTDVSVEPFYFTSLRRFSPKIMLNTETDDYGVLEERSCGCPLEDAGLTFHIRQIFSFRKLTSGGVTLVGSRMLRVLEEVLPARFGGSALDYQLVEEEDDRGFTKLSLLVSPDVVLPDEETIVDAVLGELGDDRLSETVRLIWRRTGTLRVVRRRPDATGRGKIVPLRAAPPADR